MSEREGDEVTHEPRRRQPPSLDGLVAAFNTEPGDPVEGEIWRAAWGASVQLVLLLRVGDDKVDVVPLSPDLDFADDDTVRVEPPPPLTHPLGAWRSLRSLLPHRVLDVGLGAPLSTKEVEDVRTAPGLGAPVSNPLDERVQVRAELAKRMEELEAATWIPAHADPVDIGARIRERGGKPSAVARDLGVTPGDLLDLARGDRQPLPDQAERLAAILDLPVERLMAVKVDSDLIWALDRPRFRKALAQRGRAAGVADEAAWRLRVATRELPVAARTTGTIDPRRRWMGLIQDYLDAGQPPRG